MSSWMSCDEGSWMVLLQKFLGLPKWCIRQVHATFGSCAIPGFLRGRCRRRRPQT